MRNLLDAELKAAGISAFQFQIWHIEELENLFEIIQPSDFLRAVAEKSKDPKFSSWDLNTYLFERVRRRYLRPFLFVPKGDTPALRTLSSLADRQ